MAGDEEPLGPEPTPDPVPLPYEGPFSEGGPCHSFREVGTPEAHAPAVLCGARYIDPFEPHPLDTCIDEGHERCSLCDAELDDGEPI